MAFPFFYYLALLIHTCHCILFLFIPLPNSSDIPAVLLFVAIFLPTSSPHFGSYVTRIPLLSLLPSTRIQSLSPLHDSFSTFIRLKLHICVRACVRAHTRMRTRFQLDFPYQRKHALFVFLHVAYLTRYDDVHLCPLSYRCHVYIFLWGRKIIHVILFHGVEGAHECVHIHPHILISIQTPHLREIMHIYFASVYQGPQRAQQST